MKITHEWNKLKSEMRSKWINRPAGGQCPCSDCQLHIYNYLIFLMEFGFLCLLMYMLMFISGGNWGLVIDESVEHTFRRGDSLFASKYPEKPIQIGDVVVFGIKKSIYFQGFKPRNVSIAREVIEIEKLNGTNLFLVNYNNSVADRGSESGKLWMTEQDIIGKLRFTLPYAGIGDCLKHESLLFHGGLVFLFLFVWAFTICCYPFTTIFTHGMSEEDDDDDDYDMSEEDDDDDDYGTSEEDDVLPTPLSSSRFYFSCFEAAWRFYAAAYFIVCFPFGGTIIE